MATDDADDFTPMSMEEAQRLMAQAGTTDRAGFRRLYEAFLVAWGRTPKDIRYALERFDTEY